MSRSFSRRALLKIFSLPAIAAVVSYCGRASRREPSKFPIADDADQLPAKPGLVNPPYANALPHVVAIGDTGTREAGQFEVAQALIRFHDAEPFSQLLMLGDNVYPMGGQELLKASMIDPYQELIDRGVQIRVVLGNHDVAVDGGLAQLQNPLFNLGEGHHAFVLDDVNFIGLNTNPEAWNTTQQQWLRTRLLENTSKHCVVYAHHPIFSSGMHGNNSMLAETLLPILREFQVDLYLAGHDHIYERLKPFRESDPLLIVAGNGGYVRDISPNAQTEIVYSELGFVSLKWTDEKLDIRAFNSNLELKDKS